MTIEVETGAGSATGESYASVSDVDTFQSNRGVTLWATLSTAEKEQALRRATQYMEQMYRLRWVGRRFLSAQSLSWPRIDARRADYPDNFGTDEIPAEVVSACCELAFKAAFGDLSPDVSRMTRREKVDVIEVEYEPGAAPFVRYRSIDNLLAPLMSAAGSTVSLVRA